MRIKLTPLITIMKIKFYLAALALMASATHVSAQTLATAYKADTEVNPILPYNLCADPTAVEYNGRLYVYGTNDQQELNTTNDKANNTYGKITQLVCMSSADLVNWTFHGPIDVKAASSWIWTSWAPSIVSREESDGKTHFYMYYTNSASGIGVLTSTSPLGPWRDPLGKALVDGGTKGRGEQSNIIDPGVCIDDEGNGWLAFGGGDPNKSGSKLFPGNARIVKLGKNMISLSGTIYPINAPFHFEANELNYINGKFVFSYSGGWSCNSNDWSTYDGKGSYSCPGQCSILSMTTDDPTTGEWTYRGEMLKNPGAFNYPWGNNHSHLQKFGNSYYMLYHTQQLANKMGLTGGYRGIAINKATVNTTTGKATASMTNIGTTLLSAGLPQATEGAIIQAETMANCAGVNVKKINNTLVAVSDIHEGDWTVIRSIAFPEGAKSVKVRVRGAGTLELRSSKTSTSPIATVEFSSGTLWKEYEVDLAQVIEPNRKISFLYFVFTKASGNVQFDYYSFSPYTMQEATAIKSVSVSEKASTAKAKGIYGMDGRKLHGAPKKGFYIENGKKKMMR